MLLEHKIPTQKKGKKRIVRLYRTEGLFLYTGRLLYNGLLCFEFFTIPTSKKLFQLTHKSWLINYPFIFFVFISIIQYQTQTRFCSNKMKNNPYIIVNDPQLWITRQATSPTVTQCCHFLLPPRSYCHPCKVLGLVNNQSWHVKTPVRYHDVSIKSHGPSYMSGSSKI